MRHWRWGESVEPLRACLRQGGVLAIPTESSYGLAVDPRDEAGVAAVYRIKGRDRGKAIPVLIGAREQLAELQVCLPAAELSRLVARWPSRLTVVVPVAERWPAMGGEETLAIRMPAHGKLRELLLQLGPLTATSANRAAAEPCLCPAGLSDLLAGEEAIVVNDGPLPGGPPSTVAAWEGGRLRLLRPGAYIFGSAGSIGRDD